MAYARRQVIRGPHGNRVVYRSLGDDSPTLTEGFYDKTGMLVCSGPVGNNRCTTEGRTRVVVKTIFAPANLAEAQAQAAKEGTGTTGGGIWGAVAAVGAKLSELVGGGAKPTPAIPAASSGMSTNTKVAIAGGALLAIALLASRK